MYLHHILRRPDKELIHKFYKAQALKISRGDWAETVSNDKIEINLQMDDLEISKLSKYKFKNILKKKIMKKAFDDLKIMKEGHSKMSNIIYGDELKIQKYLKSDSKFTNDDKSLLFKMRTRMTEVKNNFKNKFVNLQCFLCKSEIDDQSHLFYCQKIIENCHELAENIDIEYEDIFSEKSKQLKAIKLIAKIWKVREKLISEIT